MGDGYCFNLNYVKGLEKEIEKLKKENKMIVNKQSSIPINFNPNPENYNIIKSRQINEFLIVLINYPDCINFEGNKILIYKDCNIQQLINQKTIDPHFSDSVKFYSPICRFIPTDKGWSMAISFCENYKE